MRILALRKLTGKKDLQIKLKYEYGHEKKYEYGDLGNGYIKSTIYKSFFYSISIFKIKNVLVKNLRSFR